MFRGITAIQLDDKGRLAFPRRYRDRLLIEANGQLVLTIETELPCLLVYALPEWEALEGKLAALPSFNPVARRIQRLLIGHAAEVALDNQGRILVPPLLREYAGLEKELILLGQGRKFELWDETKWNGLRKEWLAKGLHEGDHLPDDLSQLSL